MIKLYRCLAGALVAALMAALLIAAPSQAAEAATAPAVGQTTVERWRLTADMQLVPLTDTGHISHGPIQPWQYYPPVLGQPICIKDYTPETTVWNTKNTAAEWSAISYGFHMYWDDMNDEGVYPDNYCGSYDSTETVALYSFSGGSTRGCGEVDIVRNENHYVLQGTVWMNRTGPSNCVSSYNRKQHAHGLLVGAAIGVAPHYNVGATYSVMSQVDSAYATVPWPTWYDIAAGDCQYGGHC